MCGMWVWCVGVYLCVRVRFWMIVGVGVCLWVWVCVWVCVVVCVWHGCICSLCVCCVHGVFMYGVCVNVCCGCLCVCFVCLCVSVYV